MVWIQSFSVWGLAGRRSPVKYSMNRDVNILWGTNGCGKTSLLKILHSALTNNVKLLKNVPFEKAEVKFFTGYSSDVYMRTIDKSDTNVSSVLKTRMAAEGVMEDELADYVREVMREQSPPSWVTRPELPPRTNLSHGYLSISRVSERDARFRQVPPQRFEGLLEESTFDQIYADHIQSLWRRYATDALRKTTAIQRRALSQVARTVIERNISSVEDEEPIDARHAFDAVTQFFKAQNLRPPKTTTAGFVKNYQQDSLFRKIVKDIANVQYEIESSSFPVHEIEDLLGQLFFGAKKIVLDRTEVSVRSGDREVPLHSLASGEKQLLRILLECLAAGDSCIIIDEPEISLHVDWQHDLVRYMRLINPHLQVIAATHSPEIMAELDDSSIFKL